MRWIYLRWSIAFWLGTAWLFVGLLLGAPAVWRWHRYSAEKSDFYETRGTVAEKFHRGKNHTPTITAGYLARDGQPHTADIAVPRDDWDQYRPGGEVLLYVAGDDPDDAWLQSEGGPSATLAGVLTAIATPFFLIGLGAFVFALSRATARANTLANGTPFEGRILSIEGSGWTINRVRYSCYRYGWTGTDGVAREGMSLPFHPRHPPFAEGAAVKVFVDPSAPERGEIKLGG